MADDNVEVTHQSGFSRLANSLLCAVCIAPLVVIGGTFVLGWNERQAVCNSRAITQGEASTRQVGCASASENDGELVLFACPLDRATLPPLTLPGTDFDGVMSYKGTGLRVNAEMLQCVEHSESKTEKDTSGGGGTTTTTTYTYSKEWRSSHVDSTTFHKKESQNFKENCNGENPVWPAGVPASTTHYASSVGVGNFTVGKEFVEQVPLDTPVTALTPPTGWVFADAYYTTQIYSVPGSKIGTVRVSFQGTNWSSPMVTVLGENQGGMVSSWTAPDSWLCSGFGLGPLLPGTWSKEELFDHLQDSNTALTIAMRILGFLLIWAALSSLAGPLEVAADCIPCVGPWIGDNIQAIACCITCPPALACALGVIGVVWVAMRPLVGIPLVLLFVATCCAYIGFAIYQRQQKSEEPSPEEA